MNSPVAASVLPASSTPQSFERFLDKIRDEKRRRPYEPVILKIDEVRAHFARLLGDLQTSQLDGEQADIDLQIQRWAKSVTALLSPSLSHLRSGYAETAAGFFKILIGIMDDRTAIAEAYESGGESKILAARRNYAVRSFVSVETMVSVLPCFTGHTTLRMMIADGHIERLARALCEKTGPYRLSTEDGQVEQLLTPAELERAEAARIAFKVTAKTVPAWAAIERKIGRQAEAKPVAMPAQTKPPTKQKPAWKTPAKTAEAGGNYGWIRDQAVVKDRLGRYLSQPAPGRHKSIAALVQAAIREDSLRCGFAGHEVEILASIEFCAAQHPPYQTTYALFLIATEPDLLKPHLHWAKIASCIEYLQLSKSPEFELLKGFLSTQKHPYKRGLREGLARAERSQHLPPKDKTKAVKYNPGLSLDIKAVNSVTKMDAFLTATWSITASRQSGRILEALAKISCKPGLSHGLRGHKRKIVRALKETVESNRRREGYSGLVALGEIIGAQAIHDAGLDHRTVSAIAAYYAKYEQPLLEKWHRICSQLPQYAVAFRAGTAKIDYETARKQAEVKISAAATSGQTYELLEWLEKQHPEIGAKLANTLGRPIFRLFLKDEGAALPLLTKLIGIAETVPGQRFVQANMDMLVIEALRNQSFALIAEMKAALPLPYNSMLRGSLNAAINQIK